MHAVKTIRLILTYAPHQPHSPSKLFPASMKKTTAVLLLFVCHAILSFAWGAEGHQIVADIAGAHLNRDAAQKVQKLLGTDNLASVSMWADDVRPQRPETYGWHFVDIPMHAQGFSEPRDCYRPDDKHPESLADHHNCVVDRINIFERTLADKNALIRERVEALKFLVHFVADIHQPLHAMGEARGGNDIHVVEFGSHECGAHACNLHYAWDIGLVEHAGRDERAYVFYEEELVARHQLQNQAHGTPGDWANESFHLAHQIWLRDRGSVDQEYYSKVIAIVNQRLALAGVRLAVLLNQALGN
jgi:S1/P1 Nuclease